MRAAVIGIEGPELTTAEAALFAAYPPAGIILFGRNIEGALALTRLIGDIREVLPPGGRLMVDQEGGRVARLRPPDWSAQPSAAFIGAVHRADPTTGIRLAWLTGALIGQECREAGFDVVCAPVLDLIHDGTTDAIGDRSYGTEPTPVAALAQALADGLLSAGIEPVGKHAPGHGRARVDSHLELPVVDAHHDLAPDFSVFAQCSSLPWMMTAHLVYSGLDPSHPATLSPHIIAEVIRGEIGFEGVLISDDLAMGALTGTPAERARAAIAAGCDLALHCSGQLRESEAVLRAVPAISPATRSRLAAADALASRCKLSLERRTLIADQRELLEAVLAP